MPKTHIKAHYLREKLVCSHFISRMNLEGISEKDKITSTLQKMPRASLNDKFCIYKEASCQGQMAEFSLIYQQTELLL